MDDSLHYYMKIARWSHRILFEPFKELNVRFEIEEGRKCIEIDDNDKAPNDVARNIRTFSQQMFCYAWYVNCDNGVTPMDVYAMYYQQYNIPDTELQWRVKLVKFELDWRIKRMKEEYDKDDWYTNPLFDCVPYSGGNVIVNKRTGDEHITPVQYMVKYMG